jgi:cellulose synthase/poly-beta-1,6-N-acetylglucosamine synthase-like glycosyltransferase
MTAPAYVFWASLGLVAHTYLLYPIVLFFAYSLVQVRRDWRYLRSRRDGRCPTRAAAELPPVTLIIAAHNEETHLRDKLANIRQLDYPRDRLDVIIVSDGSTDDTNAILRAAHDPNIRCIFLPARGGKSSALNHAVAQAHHDILIFSDAATRFAPDAVAKLARHFVDQRVGAVCGSLEFEASPESRQTEGVYWAYESMLRFMEARLGATLTASGAIYALRRGCFPRLSPDTMTEDLVIPMHARKLGYRVLYDPEAVGTDIAASSVAGEFARRVRIATGSFRALGQVLRTPLDPVTAFAFFSHKFLRWILPFLLIAMLVSSGLLWSQPLYRIALLGQLAFYVWAALGFLFRQRLQRVRFGLLGYYLLAIHLAFLVGFVHFVSGRHQTGWQRVGS